jgi:hypothetical protein
MTIIPVKRNVTLRNQDLPQEKGPMPRWASKKGRIRHKIGRVSPDRCAYYLLAGSFI